MFPFDLDYLAIEAESGSRVRVDGCMVVRDKSHLSVFDTLSGAFTSIWEREGDGNFRMRSFEAHSGHKGQQSKAKQPIKCPDERYRP
jgi:hypothetical protein